MYSYNHTPDTDELFHYGVIGMKWGIHRGNVSQAYSKASKKLNKLDQKATKAQNKATKKAKRSAQRTYGLFSNSERSKKATWKAGKAQYKANKKIRKAKKWYDRMEKEFSNTTQHLSTHQKTLGRKYDEHLRRADEFRSYKY